MDKCISCEKQDTNSVKFPCPGCGVQLMRCHKCRGLSIEYTCIKCGYKGP
ncbi:RNA-binding protein [archaeon]|nr:RNA-binding protein [archaeon]